MDKNELYRQISLELKDQLTRTTSPSSAADSIRDAAKVLAKLDEAERAYAQFLNI